MCVYMYVCMYIYIYIYIYKLLLSLFHPKSIVQREAKVMWIGLELAGREQGEQE